MSTPAISVPRTLPNLNDPDPDPADHETDGQRQEDRQFRVLSKGVQQHVRDSGS